MQYSKPSKRPIHKVAIAALKHVTFRTLPAALLYWLWHLYYRRKPRFLPLYHSGHREIPVQENAQLHVSWTTVDSTGSGPTASLFVHGEEVMKLDCFGGNIGHMHLNPEQDRFMMLHETGRIYYKPGTRAEHVDQAEFDLATNTKVALLSNKIARIRKFSIDQQSLAAAAQQMARYMKALIAEYE